MITLATFISDKNSSKIILNFLAGALFILGGEHQNLCYPLLHVPAFDSLYMGCYRIVLKKFQII
jgi:hypothetical protein